VRLLHEHTGAPVPWPYLYDEASDIFGWPYVIMPRMPGVCHSERTIREALAPEDQRQVAFAAGAIFSRPASRPMNAIFAISSTASSAPAASRRRATSPPSPSIAGRTAMPTNTIRYSIRIGRPARRRMSSAAHASDASRSPIRTPPPRPIPTRRSIRRIAPFRSCFRPARSVASGAIFRLAEASEKREAFRQTSKNRF